MAYNRGIGAFASIVLCQFAAASNPVTGNGFGFAVVKAERAEVSSFYPHPYSFVRPEAANPLSEGVPTANFITRLTLGGAARGATAQGGTAEYEEDSQVVHIRSKAGEGFVFMPFGMARPVLVASWEAGAAGRGPAGLPVVWKQPVKSQRDVGVAGVGGRLLRFEGIEDALVAVPLGRSAWALVALENGDDWEQALREFAAWRGGLKPRALVEREIAQVEAWRAKPAVHFHSEDERHLWRQSEMMLRMAQCREPNGVRRHGNGLMVAALPDGQWFTPWVRDMSYATMAFIRMGHREEARAALLAYFNAQPTGKLKELVNGADYQVSVVRYFGDGSEEPFFTMEGSTNVEYDSWGEALWVLGEYERQFGDAALLATPTYRGPLYESARDYVARPLMKNLEPYKKGMIAAADTSIWEERQKDKKHFAFSTAMAIVGLREFAEVAGRAGDGGTQKETLQQEALLQDGFDAAFIRNGTLHGTLEEGVKNDIDGALMPAINFGLVRDPKVVSSTVDRMELLKVASGGYRRVRGTYTDPAIYEFWYEKQEFLFVDLSLAELYRRMGRTAEADSMLRRIVEKAAADHNIIPEMYVAEDCKLFHGALGDPTGAIPMAGYGAGAYILHVMEREKMEGGR